MADKFFFERKAYGDFNQYTDEKRKDRLTLEVAGIYKVCAENLNTQNFMKELHATNFTDRDLLRDTIQQYLAEVTDTKLAGQIFDILENMD